MVSKVVLFCSYCHLRIGIMDSVESLSLELATRKSQLVWIETGLFVIINVAAFVGNLSVCYAVYRNQRLRMLSNMFVIALAISDILMSTCCMPFSVAILIHGQWIFGEAFCRFHGFGVFTFGLASLHTMGIIAVSRYFCVVRPGKYIVLFKKQRTLMYIAVVWCVALIGSMPPFFFLPMGFNSSPVKRCVYTHSMPTLLIQSLSSASTSVLP